MTTYHATLARFGKRVLSLYNIPMGMLHLYRWPALSPGQSAALIDSLARAGHKVTGIKAEYCFNCWCTGLLDSAEQERLTWLLSETFEPQQFSAKSFLSGDVIEVGPRLNFQTTWSANAVSIARATGITHVTRIERSRRYVLEGADASAPAALISMVHDRMTETPYPAPLESFQSGIVPEPVTIVPVIERGPDALRELNRRMGLGLDDWDIEYYHNLFVNVMKRNPTTVECFDLGQSNSEHSRHWFFKGSLVIDGERMPENLMEIVGGPIRTQGATNSVIAFADNSSAIRGFKINTLLPEKPGTPGPMVKAQKEYHLTFTAETHNFPTGVAPFPGAETGTGGRIRDVQAVGRGGLVVAGTAGYCVGNLHMPGYEQPWEDATFSYPSNLASPLSIEISASNGASDYGNKFGEPLIQGFTRSFGMRLPNGERREWIKPIMFTGGIGQMDAGHVVKGRARARYAGRQGRRPGLQDRDGRRRGIEHAPGRKRGGAGFQCRAARRRRDGAEAEPRDTRVHTSLGSATRIESIHDQGAGGNCNVLKELVAPAGGRIAIRKIELGDDTLSVLEIWGAEYQEQDALLLRPQDGPLFEAICRREKVPVSFVGEVTGDGRVVVWDNADNTTPVSLDLKHVLAEMPSKTFTIARQRPALKAPELPAALSLKDALGRVLRLVSVGSKRFLTNKVDRSVTGLIARQQCAGPLGLTVADVAVVAQSHFGITGAAISIGEQPIKGFIDPAAMARMSVAEALTNMVWAPITRIEDIKASGNWMWAAKLPGEGALIYDAAVALRDVMITLGIAIDGGKDSLSMAALDSATGEMVKSPGTLVISAYAPATDITKVVTPDIKLPGRSVLLHVDLAKGRRRIGGSALLQCYGQIGDVSPDIEDAGMLRRAFGAVQALIREGSALAGHDISDGGIVVAALEMAFAGNCGLTLDMPLADNDPIQELFSEEAGLLIECEVQDAERIINTLGDEGVECNLIGITTADDKVTVRADGRTLLCEPMTSLRSAWEETSYRLERRQCDPACADEESRNIMHRPGPEFSVSFNPAESAPPAVRPKVAIIREEGSNSDREMSSAFYMAGFEPWDITVTDLMEGRASLDAMRGLAFVGGFCYADVLDSAKGWAGTIRFNARTREEFDRFYARPDTFSLGVCNGCQLMALLGWVPWRGIADAAQPRFIHNRSGRFESRFSTVRIYPSPAMMLKGMEGSVLGVWVAHGEGMLHFPDRSIYDKAMTKELAPVRFVDDMGEPTEAYPFNPNGSPHGITSLCSPDGRHLALMPHPERSFLPWQWAWMPDEWKREMKVSPWLKMFQNARQWCER